MFPKIKANIPNSITCLNLLCGSFACIMAFANKDTVGSLYGYQWAFIFIGASAVFDFLDGAMARLLHVYSLVGKELDSLSDLISFGLAPALLVFNTMMAAPDPDIPAWPAYTSLLIVLLGGIRLARFNVDDRQTTSFIGLPIPANALFWVGTVAWTHTYFYPGIIPMMILIVFVSSLMVCPLPMFSLKFSSFAWKGNRARYLILLASLLLVIFTGVPGFAWAIALYIVMSAVLSLR